MKVYVIASAAQQAGGDFKLFMVEKAFQTQARADEYLKSKARQFTEVIQTEFGPIECHCERQAFEVNVEE